MNFSTFFLKMPATFLYTFEFYFVVNSCYYDINIHHYEFYFVESCSFFLFFQCMYAISFLFHETIFKTYIFYVTIPTKKNPLSKKNGFFYISNSMRLSRQNFHSSFLAWSMKTILYNPFVCLQYGTHKPYPLSNGI